MKCERRLRQRPALLGVRQEVLRRLGPEIRTVEAITDDVEQRARWLDKIDPGGHMGSGVERGDQRKAVAATDVEQRLRLCRVISRGQCCAQPTVELDVPTTADERGERARLVVHRRRTFTG